jgi:serine/threonine-protein kinase
MATIGKYTIHGLLGRGGMGKVYKVRIPVIDKMAALKLLDPDPMLVTLIGLDALRERFIREANTMAGLSHPNIAAVWNFDEADGKPFYLMDYYCNNLATMIGETYRTENPSRVLKLDKVVQYTRQILDGLACLHHAGIIHGDIKPFNILVTHWDTVKICDFGLSKQRGEGFQGPPNLKVGTPWYGAPEQEENAADINETADLYAVGIVLYRMLTGRLPHNGRQGASIDPPSRYNPDLDRAWDRFILQTFAARPRDRIVSATAMRAQLDALYTQWQSHQDQICEIPAVEPKRDRPQLPKAGHLRVTPIKVAAASAPQVFHIDPLWRPKRYTINDFRPEPHATIRDRATGLLWQQSGSEYPLTWDQAHAYIDTLNRDRFAGRETWRLPTTDELISLLQATPHGRDFCLEPVFDTRQRWLWSADRKSFVAAWYVNTELGFIAWQDFSCRYYIKAVCSC